MTQSRPSINLERDMQGFVYAIRSVLGGPIKIGFSARPLTRLRELQNHSPVKLVIVGRIAGTDRDEHEFHRELRRHRIHGEWFRPHPDVLAEVNMWRFLEWADSYLSKKTGKERLWASEPSSYDMGHGVLEV